MGKAKEKEIDNRLVILSLNVMMLALAILFLTFKVRDLTDRVYTLEAEKRKIEYQKNWADFKPPPVRVIVVDEDEVKSKPAEEVDANGR